MTPILARIFGKKVVNIEPSTENDRGCAVTAKLYKNVLYILKIRFFDKTEPVRMTFYEKWTKKQEYPLGSRRIRNGVPERYCKKVK